MALARYLSLMRLNPKTTTTTTLSSRFLNLCRMHTITTTITIPALSSHKNPTNSRHPTSFYPPTRNFCTNSSLADHNKKPYSVEEGRDFEHWFVLTRPPPNNPDSREHVIDYYIKTLAEVVGSEEEARLRIYNVFTYKRRSYFAFSARLSEELTHKLRALPNVHLVLADEYVDVENKDYGGEPFKDGQALPFDPKMYDAPVQKIVKEDSARPKIDPRTINFDAMRRRARETGKDSELILKHRKCSLD